MASVTRSPSSQALAEELVTKAATELPFVQAWGEVEVLPVILLHEADSKGRRVGALFNLSGEFLGMVALLK